MRARLWAVVLGAAVAAWAAGCEDSRECRGDCPSIADSYTVRTTLTNGACGFTPWLLPPTVTLSNLPGGDRVSLELIDPANQLAVPLVADLRVPEDVDSETIATFSAYLQVQRQVAFGVAQVTTLQVAVSGAVSESDGRRWLSLTLMTLELFGDGCTSTQLITAEGSRVPAI